MSRLRGPRRLDRRQDREEIVALAADVWRRAVDLSVRAPCGAAHYWLLFAVTIELSQLLEVLDAAPCKPHPKSDAPPSREFGHG